MAFRLKPLERQVVVLTGATSGIGLATARMAAERGAALALAARNDGALQRLAKEIETQGGCAIPVATDMSKREEVERLAQAAIGRFGGFDTWINGAAVALYGPLAEVSLDDQRQLFDINYWGVVYGSLEAAKHLRGEGGAIINIGSILSDMPIPLQGAYTAAKHAVKGFTNTLRIELEHDGAPVAVTLIKPSGIDTPFAEHARNAMPRNPIVLPPAHAPRTVAAAILHAAQTPMRELTVGGGGWVQKTFYTLWPSAGDRLFSTFGYDMQQTEKQADPARRDNLYQPKRDGAERSSYGSPVMPGSLFTEAQKHPALALGAAAALGMAALRLARRPHRNGR